MIYVGTDAGTANYGWPTSILWAIHATGSNAGLTAWSVQPHNFNPLYGPNPGELQGWAGAGWTVPVVSPDSLVVYTTNAAGTLFAVNTKEVAGLCRKSSAESKPQYPCTAGSMKWVGGQQQAAQYPSLAVWVAPAVSVDGDIYVSTQRINANNPGVLVGDTYPALSKATLYSINPSDGTIKWSSGVIPRPQDVCPTPTTTYPRYQCSVPNTPVVSPDGAMIYVPNKYGNLWAIYAKGVAATGLVTSASTPGMQGTARWNVQVGKGSYGPTPPAPIVSPDSAMIYAQSSDKNLYAIDASTGHQLWSYAPGWYVSPLRVSPDGAVIYVVQRNPIQPRVDPNRANPTPATTGEEFGALFAIHAKDGLDGIKAGTQKWSTQWPSAAISHNTPAAITSLFGPLITSSDGAVIYGSFRRINVWPLEHEPAWGPNKNNLSPDTFAIDAIDGKIMWSVKGGGELISGALSPDGKVIYAIYPLIYTPLGYHDTFPFSQGIYAINVGPTLTSPSLICNAEPIPSYCTLPTSFPDGIIRGGANPCIAGGSLAITDSCNVICGNGYSGGSGTYSCDSTGGGGGIVEWSFKTGGQVYSSPAVSGGVVYVGSIDFPGQGSQCASNRCVGLYAIHADTGKQKWNFAATQSPTRGQVYSSPAVSGDVVYVGGVDGNLYAIDAADGTEIWNFPTGSYVESSPAVSGGVIFVGSGDGNLYAINAADGTKKWSFKTRNSVQSSPALSPDGKVVFVGSNDGNFYAINADTGKKKWSYATGSSVYSSPVVSGGVVYVGSADGYLYALNATSTRTRWIWSFKTGGAVRSSPALSLDGKVVFVGSNDYNLYAIRAIEDGGGKAGTKIWSFKTGAEVESSPAVSGGVVYVGSWDNNLYAIDATDGTKIWSYATGEPISWSSPAVSGGVVYVGSTDDNLYAIGTGTGTTLTPPSLTCALAPPGQCTACTLNDCKTEPCKSACICTCNNGTCDGETCTLNNQTCAQATNLCTGNWTANASAAQHVCEGQKCNADDIQDIQTCCTCPAKGFYKSDKDCKPSTDCQYSKYTEGTCTATCNGGTKTEIRRITQKATGDGVACEPSTLNKTVPCNTQACPPSPEPPSPCTYTDWGTWGMCSKDCDKGTQMRTRKVQTQATNGGTCNEPLSQSQSCNTQACVVDCVMSGWTQWDACSKHCGKGTQTRTRKVKTQASGGGTACGEISQSQPCNTQPCAVDCVMSDWTQWNACSKHCGKGTQTRTRTIQTPASGGGTVCGEASQSQACNTQPCAVDCMMSDWTDWGDCSKDCGSGTQTRKRTVITPASHGGTTCGKTSQSQACNTQKCVCNCPYGTSALDCTQSGVTKCTKCNKGYHIQGDICGPNPTCSTFHCPSGYLSNASMIPCRGEICSYVDCCKTTPPPPPIVEESEINVYYPNMTIVDGWDA